MYNWIFDGSCTRQSQSAMFRLSDDKESHEMTRLSIDEWDIPHLNPIDTWLDDEIIQHLYPYSSKHRD